LGMLGIVERMWGRWSGYIYIARELNSPGQTWSWKTFCHAESYVD